MARRNVMIGVAAGTVLIGAAYLLSKKSRFNLRSVIEEAENLILGIKNRVGDTEGSDFDTNAHDGRHLAEKVRHRVERQLASAKK